MTIKDGEKRFTIEVPGHAQHSRYGCMHKHATLDSARRCAIACARNYEGNALIYLQPGHILAETIERKPKNEVIHRGAKRGGLSLEG